MSSAALWLMRRYGLMSLLLGILSACGHRGSESLVLIEVTNEGGCVPEVCVERASRLQKLLTVELAVRSDCAGIHPYLSRNEWALAKTPPGARHWTLSVHQSLGPGPSRLTWLLSGPGKNYHGAGDPPQIIKDLCVLTQ
jgi:hypothetical protein